MGIDGHLSAGWTPTPKVITVTLAADSPSRVIFEDWEQYMAPPARRFSAFPASAGA